MALGIGMRTIWVGLRAVNYSKPAFTAAESSVKKLTESQKQFMKQQKALEQQSRMLMGVGLMYIALGAMVAFTMTKIIGMSKEGSQAMEKFGATLQKAGGAIGSSLLKILKPVIDSVTAFLTIIAENKPLADLFAGLLVLTTGLLLFNGIMKLVEGGFLRFGLASTKATTGLFVMNKGVLTLNLSTKTLLSTAMQLLSVFLLFYTIAQAIGDYAPVLLGVIIAITAAMWAYAAANWSAATAMSILTFGAAAAIGVGAAIAAQAAMPQFKTGTRYVRKTGPAIVHEGETITKSRDVSDYFAQKPQNVTESVVVDMRGTIIQTKANKEELRPFILRTIRDANRSKE